MTRYEERPLTRLLECYVLAAIDQLDDGQRDTLQRTEPTLNRWRPRGIKVDPNEFAMALVDQHSRSLALDRYATLRLHGGFGAS